MAKFAKFLALCACWLGVALFLEGCGAVESAAKAAASTAKLGSCLAKTVTNTSDRLNKSIPAATQQQCDKRQKECDAQKKQNDTSADEKAKCDHDLAQCDCDDTEAWAALQNPTPSDEVHACCEAAKDGLQPSIIDSCNKGAENLTKAFQQAKDCCDAHQTTPEKCSAQDSKAQQQENNEGHPAMTFATLARTHLAPTFEALAPHLDEVEATELFGVCNQDTGGTCRFFGCKASRQSTCFQHKCVCSGYNGCAQDGKCVHRGGGGYHGGGGHHHGGHGRGGARYAVDGHKCEYSWSANINGRRLRCRRYCCHIRNRYTGRRGPAKCRVYEFGRQVLKKCQTYMSLSEEGMDGDAESEEGVDTMTWGIAGVAGGSIAMVSAVIGWSAFNKKRGAGAQPLLA